MDIRLSQSIRVMGVFFFFHRSQSLPESFDYYILDVELSNRLHKFPSSLIDPFSNTFVSLRIF